MRTIAVFVSAALFVAGCGGAVDSGSTNAGGADAPTGSSEPGASPGSGGEVDGVPCSDLHGHATLRDYEHASYASSSYSFEFASQDPSVTRNSPDVDYVSDMFQTNLFVGENNWIVDLGPVSLASVPASVDPSAYPTGAWGQHDDVQAQPGHTYFVRVDRAQGRLVAAFRVTSLEPGSQVTIEWIRSPDPDTMIVPAQCGVP